MYECVRYSIMTIVCMIRWRRRTWEAIKVIFANPERVGTELEGVTEGLDGTRLGEEEGLKVGGAWVATAVTTEVLTDFTVTGLAPTLAA